MGLHEILKSGRISHNICTPPFVGISPSIEPETVNTSALKHGPQTVLKSLKHSPPLPLPACSSVYLFVFLSLSPSHSLFSRRLPAHEPFMKGITALLMTTCPCSGTVLCRARPSSKHLLVLKGHNANLLTLVSPNTSLTAKATQTGNDPPSGHSP